MARRSRSLIFEVIAFIAVSWQASRLLFTSGCARRPSVPGYESVVARKSAGEKKMQETKRRYDHMKANGKIVPDLYCAPMQGYDSVQAGKFIGNLLDNPLSIAEAKLQEARTRYENMKANARTVSDSELETAEADVENAVAEVVYLMRRDLSVRAYKR